MVPSSPLVGCGSSGTFAFVGGGLGTAQLRAHESAAIAVGAVSGFCLSSARCYSARTDHGSGPTDGAVRACRCGSGLRRRRRGAAAMMTCAATRRRSPPGSCRAASLLSLSTPRRSWQPPPKRPAVACRAEPRAVRCPALCPVHPRGRSCLSGLASPLPSEVPRQDCRASRNPSR